MNRQRSRVFAPNRVLGVVCGDVRTVLRQMPTHRNRGDLYCAIDNVVVTYSIHPLKRRIVSNCLPQVLTAVAQNSKFLYAGYDGGVTMIKSARHLDKTIALDGAPSHMVTFGGFLVLSCVPQNNILVLDSESGELIFESVFPPESLITCLFHPATYLDKIVVGFSNGQFQLINVKSGKVIHQFTKLGIDSAITCMEQTRFADIVVIGFEDGRICVYNVKYEKLLMSASQEGPVTAIAFRTDGVVDTMLTGNSAGYISVWDLNEMTLMGQLREAHKGRVHSLHTVLGQPFCVSTGDDNRIVKWMFDAEEQSMPTLHAVLEGHADQVNYVACYDRFKMLSAGRDGSMRSFNVMRDDILKSLGNVSDKCNSKKGRISEPVVEMDIGWVRASSWDNVVCVHRHNAGVSTWSTRRQAVGSNIHCHRRFYKSAKYMKHTATCARLSHCGNMAFIGYTSGHIDVFNMQSGRYTASFTDPKLLKIDSLDSRGHNDSICGIESDQRNKTLITCDTGGIMKFWSIKDRKYEGMMSLSPGATKTYLNKANRLSAVAFESGDVKVVDILCKRTVRHFAAAHKSSVTALTFSPDGKWLLSADDKGFLKVWDLMNNFLIDVMHFEHACVGLTFTECGVYLVSIHKGQRGVYVWANMAMFGFYKDVKAMENVENGLKLTSLHYTFDTKWKPFNAEETDSALLDENANRHFNMDESTQDQDNEEMNVDGMELSHDEDELFIRFSGLPVTRWVNLPDLDIIRSRNKPTEAPKEPEHAPFFLPSVSTVDGFVFENGNKDEEEEFNREKVLMAKRKTLELDTPLLQSLLANPDNFKDETSMLLRALHNLTQASISSIDFQIKSLAASAFPRFLQMCRVGLEHTVNYELIQAYLTVMLKYHGSDLWQASSDLVEPEYPVRLNSELQQLHKVLKKKWGRLENVLLDNASLIQWIKNALV